MAVSQAVQDGVIAGASTGVVTGLVAWLLPLLKSRHLSSRVKKLEAQAEKDRLFRRVMITSQMSQTDLLEAIAIGKDRCEDCPVPNSREAQAVQAKIIDTVTASRAAMQEYLKELT